MNLYCFPYLTDGKGKSKFYFWQTFFEKILIFFQPNLCLNNDMNYCSNAGAKVGCFFYSTSIILFIF